MNTLKAIEAQLVASTEEKDDSLAGTVAICNGGTLADCGCGFAA